MRNVENVEHAEDERQADGDDKQPAGVNKSIDEDGCRKIHGS